MSADKRFGVFKGLARIFSRVGQKGIFQISGGQITPLLRIYMVKIRKIAEPGGSADPPADAPLGVFLTEKPSRIIFRLW